MAKAPTDIRSLARSYTQNAVRVLAGIMRTTDAPPAARVAAATALLDRGWGKPDQHSTVEMLKRDAADWTRDELVALIHDTKAGSNGTAAPDGCDRESNQLH